MEKSETPSKFPSLRPSRITEWDPRARKFAGSFALVVIFFVFLFFIPQKHNLADIKEIKIVGQNVKVKLAVTPAEQERGLSGRSELKENEGMLFIFPQSGNYTFWMKDMNFAIDIIWLGEDLRIVYIKKDARPELYPEIYTTDGASKYVLEVVSGFSDKNNLKIGDSVKFIY